MNWLYRPIRQVWALSHSVANVAQVPQFPAPAASHPGAALGRQGVRDYGPAHLVLGEVLLRGSWTAQGHPRCRPGRHRASVGYHSEPGLLCYYGGTGYLCSCGTGGCLSLLPVRGSVDPMWWHWVAWCGCPAVPGDAVGVFPTLRHAYQGSLVTPSVSRWLSPHRRSPPVSPLARVRDVCHDDL